MKQTNITISLSQEEIDVIFRCLSYGESAISQNELENGIGEHIKNSVSTIRRKLCNEISRRNIENVSVSK